MTAGALPRNPTEGDLAIVDVDAIRPHPKNPRRHDDEGIQASMRAHGIVDVCVVQRSTGFILGGNGRHENAREVGAETVPVLFVDCDDAEAEEIMLVLNAMNDRATYDYASVVGLVEAVRERHDDEAARVARSGWTEDALARARKQLAAGTQAGGMEDPPPDFDAAADLRDRFGTELGQLWRIAGKHEHRMLIADATAPEGPTVLLGDESIDLLVTSPPYNVGVGYEDHDDTTVPWPAYRDFLLSVLLIWLPHLAQGRFVAWNIGSSAKVHPHRQAVMFEDELGMTYWREIVWAKVGTPLPTWQHTLKDPRARAYHPNWGHELIVLFTKGEPQIGGALHDVDDIMSWDVQRIPQSQATRDVPTSTKHTGAVNSNLRAKKAHPAVFPAQVAAGPITHLSDEGAVVFDPFLGAGTTILAAEQRGRRGYGVELSPEYAAVALHRAHVLGMTCEVVT